VTHDNQEKNGASLRSRTLAQCTSEVLQGGLHRLRQGNVYRGAAASRQRSLLRGLFQKI